MFKSRTYSPHFIQVLGSLMNTASAKTIKNLFFQYGLHPKKSLGQHFLIDPGALGRILTGAHLQRVDTVLEIGPGMGVLTHALAQKAQKVIAIEKDPQMVKILQDTLTEFTNVEILEGDILKEKFQIAPKHYKVVANLPYYITAPVIKKFLEEVKTKPQLMILMVQKEVAQRICAKPPRMSLLAVSVQFYAQAKIISYVNKNSFWPRPKVDSAILQITPFPKNCQKPTIVALCAKTHDRGFFAQNKELNQMFFKVAKAGFSQPRKQLINNLSDGLKISKASAKELLLSCQINPSQRAETLTIQNWIILAKKLQ